MLAIPPRPRCWPTVLSLCSRLIGNLFKFFASHLSSSDRSTVPTMGFRHHRIHIRRENSWCLQRLVVAIIVTGSFWNTIVVSGMLYLLVDVLVSVRGCNEILKEQTYILRAKGHWARIIRTDVIIFDITGFIKEAEMSAAIQIVPEIIDHKNKNGEWTY